MGLRWVPRRVQHPPGTGLGEEPAQEEVDVEEQEAAGAGWDGYMMGREEAESVPWGQAWVCGLDDGREGRLEGKGNELCSHQTVSTAL